MDIKTLKAILDLGTKGLAAMTTELRVELKDIPKEVNRLIVYNLCLTTEGACEDPAVLQEQIKKTFDKKHELEEQVSATRILPDDALWEPASEAEYERKLSELAEKEGANADAQSLRIMIMQGIKGVANYVYQAYLIGYEDEGIDPFLQRVLQRTLKYNLSVGLLFNLALEIGGYTYRSMGLLNKAADAEFGEVELTNVELGVRKNPGILVSGSNLFVLGQVLEATRETGVDVYTHGEMLSAHYYKILKNYDNFAGNYGGSMKDQAADFTSFNGPILVTTNGADQPLDLYKDRFYTTGTVMMEGVPYVRIPFDGEPDFSALIEQAKTCQPPVELKKGEFIGGFGSETLNKMSNTILTAMNDDTLKKVVVMLGTDGSEQERTYYTELAQALPKTSAVLTAGTVKYRVMNLGLGTLRGMPRLMDAGMTSDFFSIAVTALKFQSDLEKYDINGVPFVYTVALKDEQSVAMLLALIYVGVKGIYVGPQLPAYLTENVFTIFQKNFGLKVIGDVEQDVTDMFAEKEKAAEGTVSTDMLIIDIMERWPEATEILMSCGMSCVTCGSALYESLAEACMVHGLDPEDVKEVLDHELGLVEDDDE